MAVTVVPAFLVEGKTHLTHMEALKADLVRWLIQNGANEPNAKSIVDNLNSKANIEELHTMIGKILKEMTSKTIFTVDEKEGVEEANRTRPPIGLVVA